MTKYHIVFKFYDFKINLLNENVCLQQRVIEGVCMLSLTHVNESDSWKLSVSF